MIGWYRETEDGGVELIGEGVEAIREAEALLAEGDTRRVCWTDFEDGSSLSTVFLVLDHNYDGGRPILYESQLFGGAFNGYMTRYHTRADAADGHQHIEDMYERVLEKIRKGMNWRRFKKTIGDEHTTRREFNAAVAGLRKARCVS